MSITTLSSQKSGFNFSQLALYFFALIGVASIVYYGGNIIKNIDNLKGRSAVKIESANSEAEVSINGKVVGKTPYFSKDAIAGETTVVLRTDDRQYETVLNFLPNSEVIINRDLGVSENFSSGQNFWIEKSASQTVLSITSEPTGASIFIDNTEVGRTPYSSSNLSAGEYDVRIEMTGYEGQMAGIKIQKGFNLNIAYKLFPIPVPAKVSLMEGSESLYNLTMNNTAVTADAENWAKAVHYWNITRGVNLAGSGVNKDPVFDYYVDHKGDLYDRNATSIATKEDFSRLKEISKGAYLGRTSDGEGVTPQAKEALKALSEAGIAGGKTATVKQTGTGWLRVRDNAGLAGVEIARVDVGKKYSILEETTEWVKIKISDTVSGWVSKTYVDISQ
jgi:hypothetical protein